MEVDTDEAPEKSDVTCDSPTFELDDDLFQDLEDLGDVLDELSKDSDLAEEVQPVKNSAKEEDKDNVEVKSDVKVDQHKSAGKADASQKTFVEITLSDDDEIEEGEIREDDEKLELQELFKKKSEVVTKMKKLVRHKIQLTNQRNDLMQQLQSDVHLDKVSTLLKENSLLVKAISNQIFRMNPEIKILNGKIKELQSSLGPESDLLCQTVMSSPASLATEKDIENIENFFNRLSGVFKKDKGQKEKVADVKPVKERKVVNSVTPEKGREVVNSSPPEKGREVVDSSPPEKGREVANSLPPEKGREVVNSLPPENVSPDKLEKKPISVHRNRLVTKILNHPESRTDRVPVMDPPKSLVLTSDVDKIRNIFKKVCKMSEEKGTTLPDTKRINEVNVEKESNTSHEHPRDRASSLSPNESNVMESTIDMKLKEIRFLSNLQMLSKSPVTDVSNNPRNNSETVPVIKSDGGSYSGGTGNMMTKQHKRSLELDFEEPSTYSTFNKNKVAKLITSPTTATTGKPVSVLTRLGGAPHRGGGQRKFGRGAYSNVITINNAVENSELSDESFGSDLPVKLEREGSENKRQGFWCAPCERPFKNTYSYITHLESPKHLKVVMEVRDKGAAINETKDDAAAADASKINKDLEWYKGPSEKHEVNKAGSAKANTEEDSCIAVIEGTTFCTKMKLGFSHSRCFRHAKCLVQDGDLCSYAPNLCSVCMEYLGNCHTSLQCCERIFRIVRFFRKSFGVKFDWVDKPLKDWFFETYRKMQETDFAGNKTTVSYEAFKQKQKQMQAPPEGKEEEPPPEISAPPVVDSKPVAVSDPSQDDLRTVLDRLRAGNASKLPNLPKKITPNPVDALCSFLIRYSGVEKDTGDDKVTSYKVALEKTDPFITRLCKNLKFMEDDDIPSPSLLSGINVKFFLKNVECQKLMSILPKKPLQVADISFQLGPHKGVCKRKLMGKYNFTVGLAKSYLKYYLVFRNMKLAVEKFSSTSNNNNDVNKFHSDLAQSLDFLGREMVKPLRYYFKLAAIDKRRLRRSGFKLDIQNDMISTIVKKNVFSEALFDQSMLLEASQFSKHGLDVEHINVDA